MKIKKNSNFFDNNNLCCDLNNLTKYSFIRFAFILNVAIINDN